jgi:predicted HTH transcriptional regulator
VLTPEEFSTILALGRETSPVEFKGPGALDDKPFVARVIRGMLAMSNHRDGGRVILGVAQDGNNFEPVGLSVEQLRTWEDEDAFADRVAAYADPSVKFVVQPIEHTDGDTYLVIEVEEFDSVPVICRKSFDDILSDGALYVRPRRKPESVVVRTAADMRDLMELANEKELRRYLTRAKRAGAELSAGPSDTAQFNDELGDLA